MERNTSLCYCLLALALVISTVSLVLNILILSLPSILQRDSFLVEEKVIMAQPKQETQNIQLDGSKELSTDSKVYVFGYDVPWEQYQYVTIEGQLKGLSVDIIEAVCAQAKKTCHHIVIPIEYCWNSEHQVGTGLLGRWVDACAVFLKTSVRDNSFTFSGRFYKPKMGVFYSRSDKSFSADNISNLVVGVKHHWYVSRNCLLKNGIRPQTIVTADDYEELFTMLNNGTVAVAFVEEETYVDKNELIEWSEHYDCSMGWSGVMHRVDSDIPLWFNPALESIKRRGVFSELCERYGQVKDTCLRN